MLPQKYTNNFFHISFLNGRFCHFKAKVASLMGILFYQSTEVPLCHARNLIVSSEVQATRVQVYTGANTCRSNIAVSSSHICEHQKTALQNSTSTTFLKKTYTFALINLWMAAWKGLSWNWNWNYSALVITIMCLISTKTDRGSSGKSIFSCTLMPCFLQALMLSWCVVMWAAC